MIVYFVLTTLIYTLFKKRSLRIYTLFKKRSLFLLEQILFWHRFLFWRGSNFIVHWMQWQLIGWKNRLQQQFYSICRKCTATTTRKQSRPEHSCRLKVIQFLHTSCVSTCRMSLIQNNLSIKTNKSFLIKTLVGNLILH